MSGIQMLALLAFVALVPWLIDVVDDIFFKQRREDKEFARWKREHNKE